MKGQIKKEKIVNPETATMREHMGLLDKAKGSVEKAKDISLDLVSDENLASMIVAACTKQENVNEALKTKGSIYRISGIDLVMGIPPKVVFSIHREFGD